MAIKNTNTRIGTSSNLVTGGTYDLLMISYPDGFPEGKIEFNIDDTPRKITGIQKAAQTFLKILLTTKGSDLIYPNRGTMFSNYTINANNYLDDNVLVAEISDAIKDAESQAQAVLTSDPDPASQIAKIQIGGIDVSEESMLVYVQMITNAGETAQLAIPFPELDLE